VCHRSLVTGVVFGFFFVAAYPLAVAPALAGDIQEVTRDGVLHVSNPSRPLEQPSTLEADEQWRFGGDDEEDFVFGVLGHIASDADGNVYMLDIQLDEVLVLSPDGEYLRTIGRSGEGPGEFRRPVGMFVTSAGNVAIVQRIPGRIVLLTPAGEPAGILTVPAADDGVQAFNGAARSGDQFVVATQRFSRREAGAEVIASLIRVDAQGTQTAEYFEQRVTRNFAASEMDEKEVSGTMLWRVGPEGAVFVSDDFDAYRFQVFRPEGSIDRVIEREYAHRARTADEMQRRAPRPWMRRRRGGHGAGMEIKASKTDRDILDMFPRNDGTCWVLSSRGAFDAPSESIAGFDVFNADGRFTGQVTLTGQGDYDEDVFYLIGDRLFVVTGVRPALAALRGAAPEAEIEVDEEAEPMTVICYDLAPIVQGQP
jgi:hypothetical protein